MSRIKIKKPENGFRIVIKSYNSFLHAFFTVLVILAVGSFFYYVMPVVSVFFQRLLFDIIGALVWALALGTVGFLLLRSLLWSAGGKEIIIIENENFVYSKRIFNIGKNIVIPLAAVEDIKVIDYVQPKDVLHMVQSELNFAGKSFLLETGSRKLRFGAYLDVDETDEIERVLFPVIKTGSRR